MLGRGTVVLLDLDPTVGHGQILSGEMTAVDDGLALFLGLGDRLEPAPAPRVQ